MQDKPLQASMTTAGEEVLKREREAARSLVYLEPSLLRIFNCLELTWYQIPLSTNVLVDEFGRYVWLGADLFYSGGCTFYVDTYPKVAYILQSRRNWKVTELPSMNSDRGCYGLVWLASKNLIVAFGGIAHTGQSYISEYRRVVDLKV